MELAPRYCRSCGSRILVKNVCHNCNNDPIKGDNYCYDCGALTPNADNCLRCGARYKRNLPIKPVLIIGGLLIITIAVAGYFLSRSNNSTATSQEESVQPTTSPETNQQELSKQDTIVNNPAGTSTPALEVAPPKDSIAKSPVTDSSKKMTAGIFSSQELTSYNARCRYFGKNQRSNVLFFITGSSGYIKLDGKIYDLKSKRKGVDVASFSGDGYEATIRINGLSGSDKEWLAACTLIIKDLRQNTSASYKVYSSCIEL